MESLLERDIVRNADLIDESGGCCFEVETRLGFQARNIRTVGRRKRKKKNEDEVVVWTFDSIVETIRVYLFFHSEFSLSACRLGGLKDDDRKARTGGSV